MGVACGISSPKNTGINHVTVCMLTDRDQIK